MKILSLRLAGFGPYRDEQFIDFEKFDEAGIFLITGKTGAGKSSILDAICYALYNGVPRYDGAQQKLRSDHCAPDDPTFVEVVFTVGETDYRVIRSPQYEKPKKRGLGLTTSAPTAELSRRVGDSWEGMSARPVDVGKDLVELLGLTKDQFLQVILLAQNRFQQFLKSSNDDRQAVLRTLFGTERFLLLENSIAERRKELEARVGASATAVSEFGGRFAHTLQLDEDAIAPFEGTAIGAELFTADWFQTGLADLEQRCSVAESDADRADLVLQSIEAESKRLTELRRLQLRRDAAEMTLAGLAEHAAQIELSRGTLEAARRAATVWPHVTAHTEATAALEAAKAVEAASRATWQQFGPPDITLSALSESIDELTRLLGSLDEASADERRLPTVQRELADAETRVLRSDTAISTGSDALETLPAEIEAIAASLETARLAAAAEPELLETTKRISAELDSAQLADTLEIANAAADQRELAAGRAHTTAVLAHQSLMEQRLSGHAFELAAALVDGVPCAVCGSLDHPEPARTDATPVTQLDIDEARENADLLREQLDAATAERSRIATQLVEARTRTGGSTADELSAKLDSARQSLDAARSAGERASILETELAGAQLRLASARVELDELRLERASLAETVTERRTVRDGLVTRIDAQRGEFDTVADRLGRLDSERAAARDLEAAIDAVVAAEAALATARAALTVQLVEHDFADTDAVADARLSSAELRAVETAIVEHDQSVATAKSILAEPELQGLTTEPVDLTATEEATIAARAARDEALRATTTLAERSKDAARIARSAIEQLAASAALHMEYTEVRGLANALQGKEPNTMRMRLENYVLAAQLEQIVAAANVRLRVMTGGRFSLEHDDSVQYRNTASGLGLSILDEHTGRSRATHSLSGGETFLASLALALGLAEVVTNQAGGIQLDTLFIDEGFGSLDDETLEVAMSTLDGLRAGGRTIGLISHVGSMKEQIHAKLHVVVDEHGTSRVTSTVA
ncbi:SMC family ATPase [soil metagenome]